jgi:endonuclease/exonuclease/phosphatase family metal-dependent hydrolase
MKKLFCVISCLVFNFFAIGQEGASDSFHMKVMSYNVRRKGKEKLPESLWDNRKERLAERIRIANPDIIGMQEPTKKQMEDLRQLLPAYTSIGLGRGSSWLGAGTNEYNPIFYKPAFFQKLASGTFHINATKGIWTPFNWRKTGALPRICTWAKFKNKNSGKEFYVYNTHLDNKYDSAREHGAKVIRKKMGNRHPIILMGDFNAGFTNYLQTTFNNFDHARTQAKLVVGPETTRTGWADEELKQIDHILIQKNSGIKVLKYEVVQEDRPYSSDHRPAIVELEL